MPRKLRPQCLRTACDYVHLNPVRARLPAPEDRLMAYPWSTYPLYLAAAQHRPFSLRADRLQGERYETTFSVRRTAERLHLGKPEGAKANLHGGLKQPTPGNPEIQLGV